MNPCHDCGADSVPEQVYKGIQIYECTNKHRWGIIKDEQEVVLPLEEVA